MTQGMAGRAQSTEAGHRSLDPAWCGTEWALCRVTGEKWAWAVPLSPGAPWSAFRGPGRSAVCVALTVAPHPLPSGISSDTTGARDLVRGTPHPQPPAELLGTLRTAMGPTVGSGL